MQGGRTLRQRGGRNSGRGSPDGTRGGGSPEESGRHVNGGELGVRMQPCSRTLAASGFLPQIISITQDNWRVFLFLPNQIGLEQ